ncbi:hypothetical protein TL16_g06002 [Triparma laevis f. inornata]|uniref:HTTM domain-containing protein n=1 Tax=Triparma laevis f. inornata TaxID=1714386 RepID=A0A9W7AH66_9STRA|nr:hypothetical protein TL16_g06002 [Triparma laevis f. inornata]
MYGLLLFELLSRVQYIDPFYGPNSTHRPSLLTGTVDSPFYYASFLHVYASMSTILIQSLFAFHVLLAFLTFLSPTPLKCFLTWFLFLSLTLRNTWLNYILDRYFHYFLAVSIFTSSTSAPLRNVGIYASRLQLLWLYIDAGMGKVLDPLNGWTTTPLQIPNSPIPILPALDSYTRHTLSARIIYTLLTPTGLKYLTPIVAYAEVVLPVISIFSCFFERLKNVQILSTVLVMGLHIGIGLTINNTALLSLVACTSLILLLPISSPSPPSQLSKPGLLIATLILTSCVYFETTELALCSQDTSLWPTLLHNRWNVFTSSETYVTWEIAPGVLSDNSVVDVWGKGEVSYELPGAGAASTSTPRRGRWRSFPYLKEMDSEFEKRALWNYLCRQWNEEHPDPNSQLLKFNFFMLQADVLPELSFGETRKRHIISWDCVTSQEIPSDESSSPQPPTFMNTNQAPMRARENLNKIHQNSIHPNKIRSRVGGIQGKANEEL